jgi:hypothetical protein
VSGQLQAFAALNKRALNKLGVEPCFPKFS